MGSGYQMRYQSAETMGTAFASDVSGAKTASGFYNNPAMIAFMDEAIYMSAELTNLYSMGEFEGSTDFNSANGTEDDFGGLSLLPSIYYGQKIKDNLYFTATLTVPWATSSDYDKNWIGRYQAVETNLTTINLTPSVVYAISDKLSVSGGVQVEYATGVLSAQADTGSFVGTPGQADSLVEFDGDNLGFGLALSAMFKPSDTLRLGFQYKSQIKHNLEGKQSVSGFYDNAPAPVVAGADAQGIGDGQSVNADIVIPDNITLGASYLLNESIDLHASLSWTGWSSFDQLNVNNTSVNSAPRVTTLDWKDTYLLAYGADYFMSEALTLRAGLSYETGAPPDAKRTPRGVDDDRLGIALGGSFKLSELLTLHGAFTQIIFLNKPTIDLPDPPNTAGTDRITGDYSNTASIVRLGVSAKF